MYYKKAKALFLICMAGVVLTSCKDAKPKETSLQAVYAAYADYLENNSLYEGFESGVYETDETKLVFSLVHIDEDEIPELIIGWTKQLANSSDICILKYKDGNVISSGPIGHYNNIGYIPGKNVLYEDNYDSGIFSCWYGYLNDDGGLSTYCESYEECPEGESLGFTYYVKGEEVSESEYNNYLDSVIDGEFANWSGYQSSNITYLLNEDSVEQLRAGDIEVDTVLAEVESSFTDYSVSVDITSLYEQIDSCDSALNFEGKWCSSDLTQADYGELTITKQDSDGFCFEGQFYHHHGEYPYTGDGPNMGDASGYAHFINEHMAISSNNIDIDGYDDDDELTEGYAVFYLYNDHLYIRTTGTVGWMGGGVHMDGEYELN